jgi:hypothetical protein
MQLRNPLEGGSTKGSSAAAPVEDGLGMAQLGEFTGGSGSDSAAAGLAAPQGGGVVVQRGDARLADLCDEDKTKVAKLIQQLVKVGQENEAVVARIEKERGSFAAKYDNIQGQNGRVVRQKDQLGAKLNQVRVGPRRERRGGAAVSDTHAQVPTHTLNIREVAVFVLMRVVDRPVC